MRLLHLSLRSLLAYALLLVIISIPVSLFSVRAILKKEVDESINRQADRFLDHIRTFEYLDDLERDLAVFDHLSANIHISPSVTCQEKKEYKTLYDSLEREGRAIRQLSTCVTIKGNRYRLTVQRSLVDNNTLVMTIGFVQVVLSLLLAIGLSLINRSLSRKLWRPFYRTLNELKAYELDKRGVVIFKKSGIAEFDDLNTTVIQLMERNRRIFSQQREFIENASHELQTPLAVFQARLDDLMQSPTLSEADSQSIMQLEMTTQRMARLNKNLLLLSKIENDQFSDTEDVDLSALINCQLERLRQIEQMSGISIVSSVEHFLFRANKALIDILLTNLFNNAIRYCPQHEVIHVSMKGSTFSIANKGAPLKMSFDKMTERFSKGSADPRSTGLGLAIIKNICDYCAYQFGYAYTDSTHTFTVTFK